MRWSRLRPLSVLEMMRGVAYGGVAFACIGPMLRFWLDGSIQRGSWAGLVTVVVFEGVAVPLAWAALTFVVFRPGCTRNTLITGFLLAAVAVAEGFACYWLGLVLWYGRRFIGPELLPVLATAGGAVLVLGGGLVFLARRLGRAWRTPGV